MEEHRANSVREADGRVERRRVALALGYYDYWMNVGIARFARGHNWVLDNLATLSSNYPDPRYYDGIICLLRFGGPSADLLRFVTTAQRPVVDLVDEHREIALPRVLYDNVAIGRQAAEHLLERGFQRLIYYQMSNARVELDRRAGFEAAVAAAGRQFILLELVHAGIDISRREPRVEWLAAQLQAIPLPAAAMAQCDANMQEFLMACEAAGIAVPDQLAAVGVDNDQITSELGIMPLTSVDDNRELLGYQAAALLHDLMDGLPAPAQPVRVAPKGIVVRESSDILAVDHPKAARALRFIWKNYQADIDSVTVARAVGLSRRGLFRLFAKYLRRSVADEILKCRLNEAKRLLATTDMTVVEVASLAGFKHGEHIARVFREHVRMKPSEYRAQNRH